MALQYELDMSFNYEPVLYGTIKSGIGDEMNKETRVYKLLCLAEENDRYLCDVVRRTEGRESLFSHVVLQDQCEKERCFNNKIAWDHNVLQTITAHLDYHRGIEKERISELDIIHAQTFPEDYDFLDNSWNTVAYICGMSVPPIMIKRIVQRLIESGVF